MVAIDSDSRIHVSLAWLRIPKWCSLRMVCRRIWHWMIAAILHVQLLLGFDPGGVALIKISLRIASGDDVLSSFLRTKAILLLPNYLIKGRLKRLLWPGRLLAYRPGHILR